MRQLTRWTWLIGVGLTVLLGLASVADACPICMTDSGKQVRAGIAGDGFGLSLLATLLPFVVLGGVVAVLHFGLPRRGWAGGQSRRHNQAPPRESPHAQ